MRHSLRVRDATAKLIEEGSAQPASRAIEEVSRLAFSNTGQVPTVKNG